LVNTYRHSRTGATFYRSTFGDYFIANKPTPSAVDAVRDTVPKLIELTQDVLFGYVWEREALSKRDRSFITCAALVTLNRIEQLKGHTARALDNGVTRSELTELVTHMAFYGGWPVAMSAAGVVKDIFAARGADDEA
jgi:4-carboxymuconolactone decarboxylase